MKERRENWDTVKQARQQPKHVHFSPGVPETDWHHAHDELISPFFLLLQKYEGKMHDANNNKYCYFGIKFISSYTVFHPKNQYKTMASSVIVEPLICKAWSDAVVA